MRQTGTRLAAALLGYFILIILLLTLNPFYLALPGEVVFTFQSDLNNLVSNLLLFLPVGFFYRLATKQRGAFLVGGVVSLGIETLQLFIPARTPSVVDVLANTAGAGLGAFLHDFISARIVISRGMIGRLRLETPLMGLIYLLMSLLWVNALAAENAPERRILTLLIGVIGAIVLNELFRHWWEKVDLRVIIYASLTAGAWYFLGTGFALRHRGFTLGIGLGVMVLTAVLTSLPQDSSERRFERATLKKAFPFFFLYLSLLALWEPFRPLTAWHWILGFTDSISETSMQSLVPRIEYLAAFTILGYLLAEWRGRSEIPLRRDLPVLFLNAGVIALVLEFFVGFQVGPGASGIRAAMAILSALFGGTIYHLLRAHIRFLLRG
ncbi:MAG: VanZ family protein [Anaerolineales bacterium]|nr:VanZ family protein [Anaerolineales bacterium]NUQ83959.1 VanZ family protein [Anaerolineales bacterium]